MTSPTQERFHIDPGPAPRGADGWSMVPGTKIDWLVNPPDSNRIKDLWIRAPGADGKTRDIDVHEVNGKRETYVDGKLAQGSAAAEAQEAINKVFEDPALKGQYEPPGGPTPARAPAVTATVSPPVAPKPRPGSSPPMRTILGIELPSDVAAVPFPDGQGAVICGGAVSAVVTPSSVVTDEYGINGGVLGHYHAVTQGGKTQYQGTNAPLVRNAEEIKVSAACSAPATADPFAASQKVSGVAQSLYHKLSLGSP